MNASPEAAVNGNPDALVNLFAWLATHLGLYLGIGIIVVGVCVWALGEKLTTEETAGSVFIWPLFLVSRGPNVLVALLKSLEKKGAGE